MRAGWRDCTSPQPCGTGRTGALLAAMYFTILDQGKEVARSSTLSLSRRTDRTKNPGTHPPSRGRGLNSIPAAARSSHYPANSGVKARYRLTAGRHFSCRCPAHTGSGSASHTTTTALVFPPRVSKSPPTNNEERMKREEVVLRYPPCRVFREGVRGWLAGWRRADDSYCSSRRGPTGADCRALPLLALFIYRVFLRRPRL